MPGTSTPINMSPPALDLHKSPPLSPFAATRYESPMRMHLPPPVPAPMPAVPPSLPPAVRPVMINRRCLNRPKEPVI
jgi:hypothetical protein